MSGFPVTSRQRGHLRSLSNAWIRRSTAKRKARHDHPNRAGVATLHPIGPGEARSHRAFRCDGSHSTTARTRTPLVPVAPVVLPVIRPIVVALIIMAARIAIVVVIAVMVVPRIVAVTVIAIARIV